MFDAELVITVGIDAASMVVGSLAELFARFVSPPPETLAMFVMLAGALADTFTVNVSGG
jgi:hypothetical protein